MTSATIRRWTGSVFRPAQLSGGGVFSPTSLFAGGEQGDAWIPEREFCYTLSAGGVFERVTTTGDAVARNTGMVNGINADQLTAAARPTYTEGGGLAWLAFDGVDDTMQTANLPGFGAPFLAVTGIKANGLGGVRSEVTVFGALLSRSRADIALRLSGGEVGLVATFVREGDGTQTRVRTPDYGMRDLAPHVITGGYQGGFVFSRTELLSAIPTARDIVTTFTGPIQIGQDANESINFYGGIYVLRDNVSADEIASTEAYIAAKTEVVL